MFLKREDLVLTCYSWLPLGLTIVLTGNAVLVSGIDYIEGLAVLWLQVIMLLSVDCGNIVPVTWVHAAAKFAKALRFKP